MTNRKHRGIGFMISGVVFIGVGGILLGTATTFEWVALMMQGMGLLANLLGFATVFPDKE